MPNHPPSPFTLPVGRRLAHEAGPKINASHEVFFELVREGMTREELARNMQRRPALWGRYASWLRVLPSALPS